MKQLLVVLLMCGAAFAQMPMGGITGSAGFAPVTLGVHASADNTTTSSTTISVAVGTVTAGSTIFCSVRLPNPYGTLAAFTMTDNINSGNYQVAAGPTRDAAHGFNIGTFYIENAGAGATTVTATWGTAGTQAKLACAEWKGVRTSYVMDSSVIQNQAVTGTNPVAGSSLTPFLDGSVVLATVGLASSTPTAGANFTLLDNIGNVFPEYWIQTTKTATTGNFVDASSVSYIDNMTALAPNKGTFCDSTAIIDWTGGTNGSTPTAADLQAGTKGGRNQPNVEGFTHTIGWTVSNSTGLTYSTAAYRPFVATVGCPFYSGSGTGTLGLVQATDVANGGSLVYDFPNSQPKVSASGCISTDISSSTTTNDDTVSIHSDDGNIDYVNLVLFGSGSGLFFRSEFKAGTNVGTVAVTPGNDYWYTLTYNQGAFHTIQIFDGCSSSNPTLLGTFTANATIAGGGHAQQFDIGQGVITSIVGKHIFYGAVKIDWMYGTSQKP